MATEISKEPVLISLNPATREKIGETACTAIDQIPKIVSKAREVSLEWRTRPLNERLEFVKKFRDLLSHGRDAVSQLITREAGKPFTEAMVSEVFAVLECCQWLEKKAAHILQDRPVELNQVFFTGKRSYNSFQALGVIGIISPWNYPFSIPATSILLALTAGNGVVLKPSPKTTLVAAALVELFEKAGFPRGLIGLVNGDRLECEKLILSGIDRLVFTGSVAGGKAIMQIASQNLVPLTLELGGKHPAIVLPDVDLEAASSGLVWSAFTNGGQACASIDRLYLVNPLEASLLPRIVERARNLRLGDGMNSETDLGPLIDQAQFMRVNELVEDARKKGATILCGGNAREDLGGYFFEPTVLSDVNESMRILNEEIFGPLLAVIPVSSKEEALAKANASELALTASVWSADLQVGEDLARKLDAGVVWLNDALYSHVCPDTPWGGKKYSGFGKAHSEYELLDMVCI
ncbi:MAG: aldehyde dehydrogenase family protein, partial [Candidatus Obscuribacterales bacterium]|nr:aldehyde dehydrogenase family protein [Candidatus Obscuribacterales bacterium]